ncbi:RNA polymerase sigma-H factor [bioreactor metagenome]|uniref:RNA polymerase sigma-H factor n=1 Tax=bioreactor metagenome TaxID=1076179 RepID=A0A644YJB4_9ZZZZ
MNHYDLLTDEQLITLPRGGDALAEEQLYARYPQVVRSKARTYFLIGADREDIIQEGMIGLYKAVCDYQFDKQASFRAFAELCITRQIITAIKSATRKKHIPLNTYISLNRSVYEGDTERPLIDVLSSTQISDPEEVLIGRESYEAVADSIEHSLSKLERGALDLYLMGYSYQQIADALQKSTKCVDNAIQRVKKKLEEYLKNAG